MNQKISTDDSVRDFFYKFLQSSSVMSNEDDLNVVVEDFYESKKLSKSTIKEIEDILKSAGLIRVIKGFVDNGVSTVFSPDNSETIQYSSRIVNGVRNLTTSII